jgi:hypothetical protein
VAGARVHLDELLGTLGAQPVAHAVKAREVRRGLGRSDHVVGRKRVRRVRERHRIDLGAELLGARERSLEGLEHACFDAVTG